MANELNVLILLDIASDNLLNQEEITSFIPNFSGSDFILRLTDFGASRRAIRGEQDWTELASSLIRMIDTLKEKLEQRTEKKKIFIAGLAPLPVFAHLGFMLSKWSDVTVLNRRDNGSWDVMPLYGDIGDSQAFFEVKGFNGVSDATGRVAMYFTHTHHAPKQKIRHFIEENGGSTAGIVEVNSNGVWLDKDNACKAAHEIMKIIGEVKNYFPFSTGLVLFNAGSAPLALMTGRAVNPSITSNIWLPNYNDEKYNFAIELPWGSPNIIISQDTPELKLMRLEVLNRIEDSIGKLQDNIEESHLSAIISSEFKARFLNRLKEIKLNRSPEGESFSLSIAQRRMSIGRGLLDAIKDLSPETQIKLGQIFFLHEVYHYNQGIQTTTYPGIGRAGFALEDIDYWADAFAVETMINYDIARGGPAILEDLPEVAATYIKVVINGIEAFDRAEQGSTITRLYERRLRRYLIWHMQRIRALSFRDFANVRQLFQNRLIVEIAPLKGHLDDRYDKIANSAYQGTELFLVLNGRLIRAPRTSILDPNNILLAVKSFDWSGLEAALNAVFDNNHPILAPWVE